MAAGYNKAYSGDFFLRASTTEFDGSVALDHTFPGQIRPAAVAIHAWIRAPGNQVSGILAIWDLASNKSQRTRFTANGNWQFISNGAFLTGDTIRVEFYLETLTANLDIDSVVIL